MMGLLGVQCQLHRSNDFVLGSKVKSNFNYVNVSDIYYPREARFYGSFFLLSFTNFIVSGVVACCITLWCKKENNCYVVTCPPQL